MTTPNHLFDTYTHTSKIVVLLGSLLFALLILGACAAPPTQPVLTTRAAAEISPTAHNSPTPTLTITATTAASETPIPSATPTEPVNCVMGAEFLEDVTIPDNTPMAPGEAFTKTWRIKNTGTCNWGDSIILAFVTGKVMTQNTAVTIPDTPVGTTIDISVDMIAPTQPGEYTALWALFNRDNGTVFGTNPYVRILVVQGEAQPTPTSGSTIASNPSACADSMEFVADVTIPDNTVLNPGAAFTKTWRIRNNSPCDWNGYQLVFISGTLLAGSPSISIPSTPIGQTIEISVPMTAPNEPGTYTSIWKMQAPNGQRFGTEPYVMIIVPGDPTSTTPYPWLSGVTFHSRQIYLNGQQLGNRPNVFSKIGDSISFAWHNLWPVGEGKTVLGQYGDLQPVINYFNQEVARISPSFTNPSLAAYPGFSARDLLDPGKAEAGCNGRSPLVCEYETVRPSVAIIMIGTNDCTGNSALDEYEARLRDIVQTSIDRGVIPVLSTIPYIIGYCDVQPYNGVILSVARSFDVPLIDLYAAMEQAPNHGLSDDGVHPSIPPGENTADFTGSGLNYGYTIRNLTTLQTLDVIWRQVIAY